MRTEAGGPSGGGADSLDLAKGVFRGGAARALLALSRSDVANEGVRSRTYGTEELLSMVA